MLVNWRHRPITACDFCRHVIRFSNIFSWSIFFSRQKLEKNFYDTRTIFVARHWWPIISANIYRSCVNGVTLTRTLIFIRLSLSTRDWQKTTIRDHPQVVIDCLCCTWQPINWPPALHFTDCLVMWHFIFRNSSLNIFVNRSRNMFVDHMMKLCHLLCHTFS